MLRVNHPPRPDDVAIAPADLPIRDDRSCGIDADPGIGREIEARPAPDLSEEVRVDRRLDVVSTLLGEQHRDHRLEVLFGRLPKRVAIDRVHGGSVHWRPAHHQLTGRPSRSS